jgi:hypothetical protein
MYQRVRQLLPIVCCLAAAGLALAQQTPSHPPAPATPTQSAAPAEKFGNGTGNFTVDGTPSHGFRAIFVNNDVVSDTTTHMSSLSHGNSLVFSPNSQFKAMKNGFLLHSGSSKVASYTGITAHLPNCFAVTPLIPTYMTLYEVNYSGKDAVYVFARSADVKIEYWGGGEPEREASPRSPDRRWVVKEGETARINDLPACKPLVDFWPQSNLPTAIETGIAVGTVVSIPWWPPHNMSSQSPHN